MPDGSGGIKAVDLSAAGNHLSIGTGVGLSMGPFGNENGAVKFT